MTITWKLYDSWMVLQSLFWSQNIFYRFSWHFKIIEYWNKFSITVVSISKITVCFKRIKNVCLFKGNKSDGSFIWPGFCQWRIKVIFTWKKFHNFPKDFSPGGDLVWRVVDPRDRLTATKNYELISSAHFNLNAFADSN